MQNAEALLKSAAVVGSRALSEFDSKKLLSIYGMPITREALATTGEQAVSLAREIGAPVALKACGPKLLHKSEAGAIRLGLRGESEIAAAFDELMTVAPDLDGVLVQEMVAGNRELVMGLSRDRQFGPCVMLGLGGVFAEVLADTAFRAAPLDMVEAADMCGQLRSKAILGAFRGQKPADMEALCRGLVALGRIGLEHPEVAEIDVNPVIIDAAGSIRAVDALVVLEDADA